MRSFLLISLFSSLLTHLCFAQWEILNEGFKGQINTIDFVNENVGWIASDYGTLLKTIDGGENWTNIAINESWYINQIDFINDTIGWFVGSVYIEPNNYSIIVKTTNGGSDWSIQEQIKDIYLCAIFVVDKKNIYTLGISNINRVRTIFKTTDGGDYWFNVYSNVQDVNFNSLWFLNPDIGIVIGSYDDGTYERGLILRTTNGGTSWIENIVNEFDGITDLQFLDSTKGYFIAKSEKNHFLCKTEDMCKTWSVITQRSYSITSYKFLNRDTIFAIMGDSITANNIMKSIDGGVTWQNIQSFNIRLEKIDFNLSGNGFLLGSIGFGLLSFLYNSNDDGDNWTIEKFTYPIKDVCFVDKEIGYIVGGCSTGGHPADPIYGHVFSSIDGGKIWEINFNIGGILQSCSFITNSIGYSLTTLWGKIYKTVDNGDNWNLIYINNPDSTGFDFWGNDICTIGDNITYVTGRYSVSDTNGAGILGSFDEGENWYLIKKFPDSGGYSYNLFSICSVGTNAWAVGEGGMIVKYTPQTGWVKQTSVTDLPLKKVFFSDENSGWITGGYLGGDDFHPILLKTTNNGETWDVKTDLKYLINDIWFVNNQHGWAVGCDATSQGVILESEDGGDNWTTVVDDLSGTLNSIFVKDNYVWAVGEYGLVLRTTNAGTVWVEDENNNFPTAFKLEQNYPNPFNPSTKIKYSIPRQSIVTLKLYDILGKEIETLVNEEKLAGTYEVEFNCHSGEVRNLTSGVYFYQLKAGSYVETKKMLLIK